ncbi:MAG: hypothetical protein ACU0BK_07765 [Shimia sp.]|jgi:hypothetical protein|uniref:hypothetical protein n=1 Tax=Shimia sp. TaxID=1954381 RepID=UPI0040591FDA
MKRDGAKKIFKAADILCGASSQLITAIDAIEDASEKRAFRRKFAELMGNIERDFVYDICVKYPEYAEEKPT